MPEVGARQPEVWEASGVSVSDPLKGQQMDSYTDPLERFNEAVRRLHALDVDVTAARACPNDYPNDRLEELELEFDKAQREAERLDKACRRAEASRRARVSFVPMADGATVRVNEPDLYTRGGRSFFSDLYLAQLKGDIEAKNRIDACLATGRDPFRPGRARSRETKRAPNA
jgi:hypothetical protein